MRVRKILRPGLRRERNRRRYQAQTPTGYRRATLGNGSGAVRGTRRGFYYVRDIGSGDVNDNNSYGPPYQLPIAPGAVIDLRPKRQVRIGTVDGQDFIIGMVFDDLIAAGIDPGQYNVADPALQFRLVEHLTNLQAFPDGNGTILVHPTIYRKSDGSYGMFSGQTGIDIITGNTPSTDTQVVICQWLDEIADALTYTVSSEVATDTNLKLDSATALTLINECAAAAPYGAQGVTAWIIDDTTTAIGVTNKFHDLRGIVGSGNAGSVMATYENPLTMNFTLVAGRETITHGVQTDGSGVIRTTLGIWWDL